MSVNVKICGISEPETLKAACKAGARFIGFVFYPPSPRYVSLETAHSLALQIPTGVRSVGLFVDPTNEELEEILGGTPLDMIQLHGHESPARVAEIKERFAMPVIKALPVASAEDIDNSQKYEESCDWLLFDAKPPKGSDNPGGLGQSFDWGLLEGRSFKKPWMLSGGLTADNVSEALSRLTPDAVDVSSGVESQRGVKDADKIRQFIKKVSEGA